MKANEIAQALETLRRREEEALAPIQEEFAEILSRSRCRGLDGQVLATVSPGPGFLRGSRVNIHVQILEGPDARTLGRWLLDLWD